VLLDARPDWGGSAPAATTILLEPLTAAESDRLVGELLGTAGLDARATAEVSGRAEGNPLLLEELVAKLVDDGMLRRQDGRWTASPELDRAGVPAGVARRARHPARPGRRQAAELILKRSRHRQESARSTGPSMFRRNAVDRPWRTSCHTLKGKQLPSGTWRGTPSQRAGEDGGSCGWIADTACCRCRPAHGPGGDR
jgi:hypothetical protein